MTVKEALNKGDPERMHVAKCEYCDSILDLEYIPGVGWLCPTHLQEYENYLYKKHLELMNEVYERDLNF